MTRFWRVLLVVGVAAFGVRAAYVAGTKSGRCPIEFRGEITHVVESDCPRGDELYYNSAANHLADGGGFTEPPIFRIARADRTVGPAADHPPATVVLLAAVSWLGDAPPLEWIGDESNVAQHRWTMAVVGTVLVVLIGVLGRDVGRALRWRRSDELGWIAAGLAAVYPFLWIADGLIFAEPIANVFLVASMIFAVRIVVRPSIGLAVAMGIAIGLGALARAELVLAALLLAVPVVVRSFTSAARLRALAAAGIAALVVVAPWIGFNLARFSEPVLLSTNIGLALRGSNCDAVYYGSGIGFTVLDRRCVVDPTPPGEYWDQSQISREWQDEALEYVRGHAERVPAVVAARIGRTWSLFRPADAININRGEGREPWATRLGLVAFYPLLALAIAGLLVAYARGRMVTWVLVVPAVIVTVASALTYGQVRFRGPAEPSLVVLAAIAATVLGDRVSRLWAERGAATAPR